MRNKVDPVAKGYRTLTPQITVKGAVKAIEFYKKAFGATEFGDVAAMPDGRVGHAVLSIGDSKMMINDEFPEMGAVAPQGKAVTGSLFVYVPDVDATFKRALAAGAKEVKPVADQFWGDRMGTLVDPFGHQWSLATHIEDVSEAEMKKRMDAMFGAAK